MAELSPTSSLSFEAPERPSSVITTFYSFKGGVGRTQSLFNVGARLAAVRRNVMMVDVDLEAPGLSIGVLTEEQRRSKEGFAEIARDLLADLKDAFEESTTKRYLTAVQARYTARIRRALHEVPSPIPPKNEELEDRIQRELDVTLPDPGSLYLLSTGRVGSDYTKQVAQLPLAEAYNDALDAASQSVVRSMAETFETPVDPDRLDTRGRVFAALLREMLRTVAVPRRDNTFDHVLVDSRSGLADVGGLCLLGLAETRVVLSGLNRQNVTGTKMALDRVADPDDEARDDDHLIVVFSPVPEGELDLLAERLEEARKALHADADQVRLLHYHPRIALEERAFADPVHEYTRIYEEYEDLTDHLLHLTGSDARSLVSRALEQFRGSKVDHRYRNLVDALIPAAFLDEDHVAFVVDGLCTQMSGEEPNEDALPLFDLWVALSPDEVRVLGTTANYYGDTARSVDESIEKAEWLFQRSFALNETITEDHPEEDRTWTNWGAYLGRLAELIHERDHDEAASLYREAFDKFDRATDLAPEQYGAWFAWGAYLGRLAELIRERDHDEAADLYREASDKFDRATDLNPDQYSAWGNWGINLVRAGQLAADQDEKTTAMEKYSQAITKLRSSNEHGENSIWEPWLVVALAERGSDEDIEEAEERLQSLLERDPTLISEFDDEEAEAVRSTPALRAVLDEYREKLEEDAEDLPDADVSGTDTPPLRDV